MDALEIRQVPRQDRKQIVVIPRHEMARHNIRRRQCGLFERCQKLFILTFQCDLDERGHVQSQGIAIESGVVALDHAILLERFDPPRDGGG